jgi:DNA repair protein RecO
MRTLRTKGIIIARTDFGEADRIITFITPDRGKLKGMVKGVRRSKSKLAGGIELFSVSDLSFIPGRRDIDTIVSTRLIRHYGHIVKDLDRTNTGYSFIKKLHKATEDAAEASYFELLDNAFRALDDDSIDLNLVDVWFDAQLLRLSGHTPNLRSDSDDKKLQADKKYDFDFEKMCFNTGRTFTADHIKFLRLLVSTNTPQALQKVQGSEALSKKLNPLVRAALANFVQT